MKAKLYLLFSYVIALILGYLSFSYFTKDMNTLYATLIADIICTLVIFIFSVITNNSSIYDPYWSVIPPFIILLWLKNVGFAINSYIILGIYLIWSIRLTYNCLVNWKGFKHEDWRYAYFRTKFKKAYWFISFFGIHLFPTIMVFLGMLPVYYGIESGTVNNQVLFGLGVLISLIGTTLSYLADYHLSKHRNSANKTKAINYGIWKYSRHPNYLGEITFWLGSFIIGMSYDYHHYFTIIGFLGMVILFNAYSIPAMEKRLLNSKDDYREIINEVPRLIPVKFRLFKK